MATETAKPDLVTMTSAAVAEFVATVPSDKTIDEFVEKVAKEEPAALPVLVARATPVRKALQRVEKQAEAAIARDRVILFGQEWTDPVTGVVHVFAGDQRDRSMPDAAGCRDALLKLGAPKDMVERALYPVIKVNFVELNNLVKMDQRFKEVVDDFESERGFSPAHLKEKR